MALTATSVYAPTQNFGSIALVAGVFGLVSLPSVSSWTALGQQIRRWLTGGVRLRAFNIAMAVLLLASLVPMLRD